VMEEWTNGVRSPIVAGNVVAPVRCMWSSRHSGYHPM
jgi:hypothetical protein